MLKMGVSIRRLSSPEFLRVLPGCYTVAAEPAGVREVARILQRRVVPGSLICHVTAAELLGLPLPDKLTWEGGADIHCTVQPEQKRGSARRLRVHVREDPPSLVVDGVRVEHPFHVLLDLAPLLSHDELVACIDSLGSRIRVAGGLTVDAVRTACRGRRARGIRAVRAAVRDARDRVDSPRETMTRLMVVRAGYPEPETNRPLRDPVTGKEYWIDLAYPAWKIAIEYDGKRHFTAEQARKDHTKDELLHREGWAVLRITVEDHKDSKDFFALLDASIRTADQRIRTHREAVAQLPPT